MTILAPPLSQNPYPVNMKFVILVEDLQIYIIMRSVFLTDLLEERRFFKIVKLCSCL